uniref:Uncharacterized protein n=1 Tax=Polytomella parva TaxID=51329 RepID=A0A7S0YK64_9CHLO|mmetsp:Transcript_2549/g.3860  ORF Transcript_2549/g.3860 Transcript_2549/m.3860 type:complete len:133 (+) Transcript_2549:93-491(+)
MPWAALTTTHIEEDLFADPRACPPLRTFMRQAWKASKGMIEWDPDSEWAREELKKIFPDLKDSDFTPWIWNEIHDVISSSRANGKPIPEGVSPKLMDVVNRLATGSFASLVAPIAAHQKHADVDYREAVRID